MMLDLFLLQVRRQGTKLDKADLDRIGDIVSSFGITIDEELLEYITQHLEDFMNEVAIILNDSI
jgi:hypothetical protein